MNFKDRVIAATAEFAKLNGYNKQEEVKEPHPKKMVIDAFAECDFGCQRNNIGRLIAAMTEIPCDILLSANKEKANKGSVPQVSFVNSAIVVPIGTVINGHNYELDKPCMVMIKGGGYCMRADGTVGNSMGSYKEYVRPATDEEIDSFIKAYLGE